MKLNCPRSKPTWTVYLLCHPALRRDGIAQPDPRPDLGLADYLAAGSYVGISQKPWQRLLEHNSGKCASTRGRSWFILASLSGLTGLHARAVEVYLKKGNTLHKRSVFAALFPGYQPTRVVPTDVFQRLPAVYRDGFQVAMCIGEDARDKSADTDRSLRQRQMPNVRGVRRRSGAPETTGARLPAM